LNKTKFLELLQQKATSKATSTQKSGVGKEEKKKEPQWDVLSDSYMMGASLRDIPKE